MLLNRQTSIMVVLFFLLMFCMCGSLYAADPEIKKTGQFMLSHNLAVEKKFYFEFYDPRAATAFGEDGVSLQGFGDYTRFVRLDLYYNNQIICQAVSISFSNLTLDVYETEGNQVNTTTYTMKYSMTVYKGSSSTVYSYTPSSEYGAGTVVLLENKRYDKPQQGTALVNLAEFSISINESENDNLPIGTYTGTFTVIQDIT